MSVTRSKLRACESSTTCSTAGSWTKKVACPFRATFSRIRRKPIWRPAPTKGNVAAANVLYRRFQQRRRAQAGAARDAKAASSDAAPAAAKESDDGVLTPDWAQETAEKTDDVFATDRATAAPTTVPSSKEPEGAATAPAEAAESPAGKHPEEEKESVPLAEGDPGKADAALAQAETTEHVSSAPAAKASAASDSGAGASEAEPKPTQAAELDDLFGALKVDADASGGAKTGDAVEEKADEAAQPVAVRRSLN